jgi:ferredoxin
MKLFDILPKISKASTRTFFEEGSRTPGYTWKDALHGYIYARWPYQYISIGVGEHPLSRALGPLVGWIMAHLPQKTGAPKKAEETNEDGLPVERQGYAAGNGYAAGYHGKVMPLAAAARLVLVNEPLRLPDLEKIIPYERARDLVLLNPDHIVALDCPCRAARRDPCLPMDVCLIVGEPFASLVSEHHPAKTRWISQGEAAEILQAEDARGHVHHAFFKDAMLNRFYAICNCCACCCGAMQSVRNGTPMLAASGYVNQVDEALCLGCGDCLDYCQFGALALEDFVARVNEELCMGCGVCTSKCEQGALSLRREPAKGEPLDIQALLEGTRTWPDRG